MTKLPHNFLKKLDFVDPSGPSASRTYIVATSWQTRLPCTKFEFEKIFSRMKQCVDDDQLLWPEAWARWIAWADHWRSALPWTNVARAFLKSNFNLLFVWLIGHLHQTFIAAWARWVLLKFWTLSPQIPMKLQATNHFDCKFGKTPNEHFVLDILRRPQKF